MSIGNNFTWGFSGGGWLGGLPDETEAVDRVALKDVVEQYFNATYPAFEPEIVHTPDKDYYLPALKVLIRNKQGFFSPSRVAEWKGGELVAECRSSGVQINVRMFSYFEKYLGIPETTAKPYALLDHKNCECGIYGSVNLEEVREYKYKYKDKDSYYGERPEGETTLCIIEPSVGADVFLCRKGWRASSAFISEVVGESISVEGASQLLSIAWRRSLDIRSVLNESW